ncbi:MAG: proton-conducting transporter membrane subunit, partial [Spirochaetota bacterium]
GMILVAAAPHGGALLTANAADLLLAAVGWIGALTALFGALLAVYQSDVKYLLAYSSMSQLGYIIMAVATGSQLGWTAGLYLSLLHLVFKGMLFLAVAGVIFRTGTRRMYELGGLIKKMPLTFISSLMAIIAVSGVPPLAGFGGKWMLYTALLERGWYFQAAVAFFASTVAFLYLFKFIHTLFLGQLKGSHRDVREAPFRLILPQLLLAGGLMGVSMYPNLLLRPLLSATGAYLGTATAMDGYRVLSTLGYWNGNLVMYVTMVVFIVPLVWLMVVMRRPQAVGQFNIVYAAERPDRPETTHFAHHFFAHYDRALGFLSRPGVIAFWEGVRDGVDALGSALRRIYSGNGQTYALHIILFVVALYVIAGGLS